MRARAMRARAWSSLLLALAVFVVHSSFSLITESSNYALCALNTLVTSPGTTKTSKIGMHFIGTTFYITRSVCLSSTTHRISSILSRARYNHVRVYVSLGRSIRRVSKRYGNCKKQKRACGPVLRLTHTSQQRAAISLSQCHAYIHSAHSKMLSCLLSGLHTHLI